jgi:hypothetical protein
MTAETGEMSADLPCHVCGYDLRAHPQDGKCPECDASVAESRRLAATPLRPAWRDSDPRWRRRVLAGAWVLVLLPLMDALTAFGWAAHVPVPSVFDFRGTIGTLDRTLLCTQGVYPPLVFCIGVVLLFSKERGRRRGRLDWTRRWGVLCSYVVLLLIAAGVFFIGALVMTGVGALFQSMPLKYQPGGTRLFVNVSTAYLRYGAQPGGIASLVLVAFSSIAILLACIALFDALRSTGRTRVAARGAAILLAPLALFALMYLFQAHLGYLFMSPADVSRYGTYFWPQLLARQIADALPGLNAPGSMDYPLRGLNVTGSLPLAFAVEVTKWCIVLTIAVWLTIAQLASRPRRHRAIRASR